VVVREYLRPVGLRNPGSVIAKYPGPVAAGEALFSLAEAKLLDLYGGSRCERDVLDFDTVHCYGLPGFMQIVD
jgi:D(-)-tartrate dehydratase